MNTKRNIMYARGTKKYLVAVVSSCIII